MKSVQSVARDHRIDFVRGLALIMIFINHIPTNVVGDYTSRNFGFSDAAELFVLLAGVSSAFAYYRRYEAGQPFATSIRVWRRAGFLYTAHILTTVLAIALFAGMSILLVRPELAGDINIQPMLKQPAEAFVGLTTLAYQLSFFNILPLYIALLAMLPVMMWLYRRDGRLLLGVSLALYLMVSIWQIRIPSFPVNGAWFFNPLCWQLLFVVGFCWGDMWRRNAGWQPNPYLFWACVAYLVLSLVWMRWNLAPYFPAYGGLGSLWDFSKHFLSPFRLLHVLALAYVVAMSPVGGWMRGIVAANPLVMLGRHALPIFCFGSLLSMLFYILRTAWGGGLVMDLTVVAIGIALQVALAWFLEWQATTPAGQVGSKLATGFVAATPPVPPPTTIAPAAPGLAGAAFSAAPPPAAAGR